MKRLMLMAVALGCCAGCDMDLLGEKRDQRRRDAEMRAEEERQRKEMEEQREAMTKYVTGRRQFFKDRMDEAAAGVAALRADLGKLTSIVSEAMGEKDSKGNDQKYETKILHVLRNADVNALATKYLASDFSGIVATYIERVRDSRAADAKYAAAVKDAESLYAIGVDESKKWSAMSQQQRKAEISRLERELSALESRRTRLQNDDYRNLTRHTISQGRRGNHDRDERMRVADQKLQDLDRQISVKRDQIDYLRNPDVQRGIASRALQEAQAKQSQADSTRRIALYDIDRRLKPAKSLTDVVAEFEANTVGKLRKVLAEKITALDGEEKSFKDKIAVADEILLAIPLSEIGDLKRHKARIDK